MEEVCVAELGETRRNIAIVAALAIIRMKNDLQAAISRLLIFTLGTYRTIKTDYKCSPF